MCVKFSFEDLNPDPYLLHFTNTYIYEMIIVPKMYGGRDKFFKNLY